MHVFHIEHEEHGRDDEEHVAVGDDLQPSHHLRSCSVGGRVGYTDLILPLILGLLGGRMLLVPVWVLMLNFFWDYL